MKEQYIILALVITACSTGAVVKEDLINIFDVATIQRPFEIIETFQRNDGSVAYTNYEDVSFHKKPHDVLLEIYNLPSECSSSITGISKPEKFVGIAGKTEWGRVDAWDIPMEQPYPNALCQPLEIAYQLQDNAPSIPLHAAYAFCSEYKGKTVVLCVSQMTDNPKMAEEIFKTFKWTE